MSIIIYNVASWIAQLHITYIKSKTIKSYIYDFRFVYIDEDYFDYIIFDSFVLLRIIYDIKRRYNNNISRKRKTII